MDIYHLNAKISLLIIQLHNYLCNLEKLVSHTTSGIILDDFVSLEHAAPA